MCEKDNFICTKIEISKPSSISSGNSCAYFLRIFHGNGMSLKLFLLLTLLQSIFPVSVKFPMPTFLIIFLKIFKCPYLIVLLSICCFYLFCSLAVFLHLKMTILASFCTITFPLLQILSSFVMRLYIIPGQIP